MTTVPHDEVRVTLGVDTHQDVHVAVAVDRLGRRLGELEVPTTPGGYAELVDWASEFGVIDRIGVEGTGSWGAGLSRWLRAEGLVVVEVDRPDRKTRRQQGKSDPIDAEAAARAVLAGTATGTPKTADGPVEMIRVLRVARRSALKNRTMAANQLHALVTTAPDDLREKLRGLTTKKLVSFAARFRPGDPDSLVAATKYALRSLARRYQQLTAEIDGLDTHLSLLVVDIAPELVARLGVGTQTAAALLVTAGDNPDRLDDEGSFAHLTGTAPLDASSGKQQRHRLNRGGDRDANCALHQIAITRLATDENTKLYLKRRTTEGKTKKEAIRCLKRYIAREVFKILSRNPILNPA